jgi:ATP-dependent Lhr-like helicase
MASEVGALDPEAIAQVAAESWPEVREADELHDALETLAVLPPVPEWAAWFAELTRAGRATVARGHFWVCAERVPLVRAGYPGIAFSPPLPDLPGGRAEPEDQDAAAAEVIRGWMESTGPQTAGELAGRLGMDIGLVERALPRLEAEGQILRGQFRRGHEGGTEWCNRWLLARIHRLTIGRLRNEIEPVSAADFVRFLFRWQHVAKGGQLHGADGLFAVIRQLQGYEAPAGAWESEILPRRVARYAPELLDQLCLSGEVMWGRVSPHPAFQDAATGRRVRPTRVAPVTLLMREDAGPLLSFAQPARADASLSYAARDVLGVLEARGASFFADLVRSAHRLPSEVEDGLWELVAAGVVTADGFENLRSLFDPKRRRGEGRGKHARPRHAAGRWALLHDVQSAAPASPDLEPFARQLIRRWGVVFRDLLAREVIIPAWRDLLVVFRAMEARGEVRGGRFVSGFTGEQFAAPESVDLLRAVRKAEKTGEELSVSPADPLNLGGIVLPGPRISALTAGRLKFRDGVPAAMIA